MMTDAEMVRLCAEKVMKIPFCHPDDHVGQGSFFSKSSSVIILWQYADERWYSDVWNPRTCDSDCWQIVDKMHGLGWGIRVAVHVGGYAKGVSVRIYRYQPFIEFRIDEAEDRRRAIILACLRAVGVEV